MIGLEKLATVALAGIPDRCHARVVCDCYHCKFDQAADPKTVIKFIDLYKAAHAYMQPSEAGGTDTFMLNDLARTVRAIEEKEL